MMIVNNWMEMRAMKAVVFERFGDHAEVLPVCEVPGPDKCAC